MGNSPDLGKSLTIVSPEKSKFKMKLKSITTSQYEESVSASSENGSSQARSMLEEVEPIYIPKELPELLEELRIRRLRFTSVAEISEVASSDEDETAT